MQGVHRAARHRTTVRTAPGEAPPERRGINSIQLYCEADGRWRIVSMIWDNERPGLALPSFE